MASDVDTPYPPPPQITYSPDILQEWQEKVAVLVLRIIRFGTFCILHEEPLNLVPFCDRLDVL